MVAGFLRVVGQLFLQFGDAGFDFLAVGAVFVHFHWRKHGLRVIRQMAGGLIHFLLGQMRRADADVVGGEFGFLGQLRLRMEKTASVSEGRLAFSGFDFLPAGLHGLGVAGGVGGVGAVPPLANFDRVAPRRPNDG